MKKGQKGRHQVLVQLIILCTLTASYGAENDTFDISDLCLSGKPV